VKSSRVFSRAEKKTRLSLLDLLTAYKQLLRKRNRDLIALRLQGNLYSFLLFNVNKEEKNNCLLNGIGAILVERA